MGLQVKRIQDSLNILMPSLYGFDIGTVAGRVTRVFDVFRCVFGIYRLVDP